MVSVRSLFVNDSSRKSWKMLMISQHNSDVTMISIWNLSKTMWTSATNTNQLPKSNKLVHLSTRLSLAKTLKNLINYFKSVGLYWTLKSYKLNRSTERFFRKLGNQFHHTIPTKDTEGSTCAGSHLLTVAIDLKGWKRHDLNRKKREGLKIGAMPLAPCLHMQKGNNKTTAKRQRFGKADSGAPRVVLLHEVCSIACSQFNQQCRFGCWTWPGGRSSLYPIYQLKDRTSPEKQKRLDSWPVLADQIWWLEDLYK